MMSIFKVREWKIVYHEVNILSKCFLCDFDHLIKLDVPLLHTYIYCCKANKHVIYDTPEGQKSLLLLCCPHACNVPRSSSYKSSEFNDNFYVTCHF
jgi:hypothetical protein